MAKPIITRDEIVEHAQELDAQIHLGLGALVVGVLGVVHARVRKKLILGSAPVALATALCNCERSGGLMNKEKGVTLVARDDRNTSRASNLQHSGRM